MTTSLPKTLEEKIDYLLERVSLLESHLINYITMRQDVPTVNHLIKQLNGYTSDIKDYTLHMKQIHDKGCMCFDEMRGFAKKFRQECEPYGEVKFLNKKLKEIFDLLNTTQPAATLPSSQKEPLGWLHSLNHELEGLESKKRAQTEEEDEYSVYEKRVLPILSGLESLEKQMLLFRCKPTYNGGLVSYKLVSQNFNVEYNYCREVCRTGIRKIAPESLKKLNEYSLIKQYYQSTGKWLGLKEK